METESQNILTIAVNYLKTIEADVSVEELMSYYAGAVELEFEDGKIIRQRTYDCFEPF